MAVYSCFSFQHRKLERQVLKEWDLMIYLKWNWKSKQKKEFYYFIKAILDEIAMAFPLIHDTEGSIACWWFDSSPLLSLLCWASGMLTLHYLAVISASSTVTNAYPWPPKTTLRIRGCMCCTLGNTILTRQSVFTATSFTLSADFYKNCLDSWSCLCLFPSSSWSLYSA